MFPEEAEVVVIGGGIIGSSAAYFLAKEGKKVVLIERGYQSGEASGGNAAWVWSLTRKAGIDITLGMHSISIHRQLQNELDLDFEYRANGGMLVIDAENQLPFVEAHLKQREKDGHPLERISAAQALEIEPMLNSKKLLGAVWNPVDGTTNPILLVIALNRQAEKLGAAIAHHTEAQGIGVRGGRIESVTTNQGTIRTNCVVNAAGSWAAFISDMVGLHVPVKPFQMAMLVTEQMPRCISHPIMGASYMVEEDAGKTGGLGCGLIVSQQVSGNLLIGASWRDAGYDKRTTQEEIECMARVALNAIPALKHIRVIRSFANFFPHTSDDLPILGNVEGISGFIMASGHNGHGIALGPGSGKLIAELICDGKTTIPLDALALSRFD
jgi:glycine/D-amino acid oxidase-like deaminating enzyme